MYTILCSRAKLFYTTLFLFREFMLGIIAKRSVVRTFNPSHCLHVHVCCVYVILSQSIIEILQREPDMHLAG